MRIDGASDAVTPNIHPDSRDVGYPASVVAQAGYHMADASAPITRGNLEQRLLERLDSNPCGRPGSCGRTACLRTVPAAGTPRVQ